MTYTNVDEVVEMIASMPDEDRLALEMRLAERFENEWREAVSEGRRIAEARGIDEAAIDRAIHRRRYGE